MRTRREFIVLLGGAAAVRRSSAQDRPARILYFTHSAGYRHDVIPTSQDVLQRIGATADFQITMSEDVAVFTTENLLRYGGIMFFTTGELPMSNAQRVALTDFIQAGGGFLGVHSATDTFYQWPEYRKIIGGYFDQHPWHQAVVVEVADRDNPLVAFLGETIAVTDEIYQIRDFDVGGSRVLLRLDPTSVDLTQPMCTGNHMGGRWPGRAPMGLGAYSIQRSAMKRGCGAIPGFRCFCVMLHYGCCENQLQPSNLASSAMKNWIGRATAREPKGGQHTRRFQQRLVALTVPALVF